MASYVLQSHANSTVKKYKGYFNTFKKFCNSHSLRENPANPMTVAAFLTFLLDNDKSSHVVSSTAYAINPLPNDKFSDWSRLKAFADDKINLT